MKTKTDMHATYFGLEAIASGVLASRSRARIIAHLCEDVPDFTEIIGLARWDPILTLFLLKDCSGGFGSGPGSVECLEDAIEHLGVARAAVVLQTALLSMPSRATPPNEGDWITGYGRHSMVVARVAQLVSSLLGCESRSRFTAGLLHDIGKLGLYCQPAAFEALESQARSGTELSPEMERALSGKDHAESAGIVLENWGLHAQLVEGVRWHHQSIEPVRPIRTSAIVQVADSIAYEVGFGCFPRTQRANDWRRFLVQLGVPMEKANQLVKQVKELLESKAIPI